MIGSDYSAPAYCSHRQQHYYEEILPKLSVEIQNMDLGMRANTCLVNAEIFSLDDLRRAVSEGMHIPMLDKHALEQIKDNLIHMTM